MTLVRFFRTRETAVGRTGIAGRIACAPSRARVIEGGPDELVMPAPFEVEVPAASGRLDVELAPTQPGWAWKLRFVGFGVASETVHVLVPEPVTDGTGGFLPVDATDLVLVDPDTLIPSEDTLPAWTATLTEIQALRTETVQAASLASSAGQAAQSAAQAAQAAADSAALAANNAELTIAHIDGVGFIFTQGGLGG